MKKWELRAKINMDCRTIVRNVQAELQLKGDEKNQDEVVEYIIFNCRPLPHSGKKLTKIR